MGIQQWPVGETGKTVSMKHDRVQGWNIFGMKQAGGRNGKIVRMKHNGGRNGKTFGMKHERGKKRN